MGKKIAGRVNETEKNEIILLVERLFALDELKLGNNNLFMSEFEISELNRKIKEEKIKINHLIDNWWNDKSNKYEWKKENNHIWKIDYESGNVLLVKV